MADVSNSINAIAGICTAVGVGIAAFQIRRGRQQQTTAFEQQLTARYQTIQARIPLRLLIDGGSYGSEDDAIRRAMYDYFELCEEQAYYHARGRVSDDTWTEEWLPGIEANVARAAFRQAWLELSAASPEQFDLIRVHLK